MVKFVSIHHLLKIERKLVNKIYMHTLFILHIDRSRIYMLGNFPMRTYEKRIIILKKIYLQKA